MRPKLMRGEFYDDELLDFMVEDMHLGILGKVSEVIQSGSNKLLVILKDNNEVLIPVNGPFIQKIHKTAKKITVELPDGFLDMNS